MTVPSFFLDALQPWADLYGNSQTVSIGVTFLHLAAVMVGGGAAIATDWLVLFDRNRAADDQALRRAHRIVIPAFSVMAVTGIAMMLSDLETMAASRVFAIKLILATLLAINGAVLIRLDRASAESAVGLRRLRPASTASILLWFATLLAGCVLQVAA